ncbi:DcaP family trimeric outer membrane transporter [uncultured Rikenella sp.]|uniref:DcaP family trimeric outer membrane transporter n=1 Tax=uncultured Rikenella sp. TaxID=368003 RepID=UPI00263988A9|nr:DcaP family trimeric outer membrane transporter [uncultured Rikenella sp.]
MKRILAVFISTLLGIACVRAADSTEKRVKFKFGGRIDAQLFHDSYTSKASNGGIFYYFPLAPEYNAQGQDLHRENSLRFGVANSRLRFTATAADILGGEAAGYVETDFMGSGSNIGVLRLRHAYISLNWERSQLMIGQTNNLSVPEEVFPNTVAHGAGTPLNPQSRIPQIRYSRKLGEIVRLSAAAGFYTGKEGEAQAYGLVPDFALRLSVGDNRTKVSVSGAVKSIRPRNLTEDSIRTHRRVAAFNASIFGLHTFGGGHKLTAFAMWGEDLSTLSMLGGYGPRLRDVERGETDYGYTTTQTIAMWLGFETKIMKGWQPGLLTGWTKNLGSGREIDLAEAEIPDKGIDWYFRLSPRLWYHYKQLSFGLEYMYSLASWGRAFDAHYRPTERYENSQNHRVTLLARFKF